MIMIIFDTIRTIIIISILIIILQYIYKNSDTKIKSNNYKGIICEILKERGYKVSCPEYEHNSIMMSRNTILEQIIETIIQTGDFHENGMLIKINDHNETIEIINLPTTTNLKSQNFNLGDPNVFNDLINYYEENYTKSKTKPIFYHQHK